MEEPPEGSSQFSWEMKPTNQMKPKFNMVFFYRSRDGAQLYLKRLPQRRPDLFRLTSVL